jgi:2-alkyl-3-oxoalkanoate reductase
LAEGCDPRRRDPEFGDRKFLLTGATGNLGFAIVRRLLQTRAQILALVRKGSLATLQRGLADIGLQANPSRLIALEGDITDPFCGLSPDSLDGVTDGIHCAANVRWRAAPEDLLQTNLHGTEHFLDLCERLHAKHTLQRITVISSAYTSGRLEGRIPETPLEPPGFNNAYEASKYLMERHVLARTRLPTLVLRPTSIVGDSRDGHIQSFSTLYYPFRLVLENRLRLLPGRWHASLDFVPVDFVAATVLAAHEKGLPAGTVLHCCAGPNRVSLGELWEIANQTFDRLSPLRRARRTGWLLPPQLAAGLGIVAGPGRGRIGRMLRKLSDFAPYLSQAREFDCSAGARLGIESVPPLASYAEALCRFAIGCAFLSARQRITGPASLHDHAAA